MALPCYFARLVETNYKTAELFKNYVNTGIAASPSHFKHYNGNKLRPVLLFGLK
jgi:hypothetical protein